MRSFYFNLDGEFLVDGKTLAPGGFIDSIGPHEAVSLLIAARRAIGEARVIGRDEGAVEYRTKLRDEFAMAALAAIAFDGLPDGGGCTIESYDAEGVARQVYKIADAMLAERAKKGGA